MEQFKEKLLDLWERFRRSLTIGNILLFILIVLAILAGGALIIWISYKLLVFITLNIDLLILGGTLFGCFAYWLHTRNKAKRQLYAQQQKEQQSIDEERERKRSEDAYLMLRQIIYLVLNDTCHITRLPRITTLSSLDSPTRYVKANGYHTFMYLVAKDTSSMDINYIKEILNTRLQQGLNAQEFEGLTQKTYIHSSSRIYPIICIHKIIDMSSYLQIDVCIAGKNYADYVERSMVVDASSKAGTYDVDF